MPLDATLISLLFEMHDALDAMQEPSFERGKAGPFLSRLFHLSARLHREPELLESEQVQRLLARGKEPHARPASHLHAFARGLADLLRDSWEIGTDAGNFLVDHWARACTERSALEFALEFFPHFFEPDRAEIGATLDESDALFKARIDRFDALPHPEQIPAGVPLTHWWWRYEGA